MRVLMTADTAGGVWTYALELARQLGRRGVEVTLATMGGRPTADQRIAARGVPGLSLQTSAYKLEWMEDPWAEVGEASAWLQCIAEATRPDIAHLNGYAHGDLAWPCPAVIVGHSCVLSWWEAVHGGPAPAGWETYRDRVRSGLRAADVVVAPTAAFLAALQHHYGPLPNPRVIPNGRSATLFRPLSKEPVIVAAGRLWDEAKNIATLAEVAPRLPWPVYIAGEDKRPDGGQVRYGNVRLLGRLAVSALADRLARASIYALPAKYEPFGLSILEAGLSGCALVIGDVPSLREVWGDAAVYVPPDDAEGLEAELRRLIEDETLRSDLARRALARALELTPTRQAGSYLDVYRDVIEGRRLGRAGQPSASIAS